MEMDESRVPSRVYKNFVFHVSQEDVVVENAMDVVKSLWHVVDDFGALNAEQKKKIVIQTLEDIASGKDGILNTADDIIPPHILKGIVMLIECNLVIDLLDLICEVTQSKNCISWSMYICRAMSYVTCCCPCMRKKPKPPELRVKSKSLPANWKRQGQQKEPLLLTAKSW